jgi:hypothetical protein
MRGYLPVAVERGDIVIDEDDIFLLTNVFLARSICGIGKDATRLILSVRALQML